jgi:ubiquinone/menaquinone biosynthesis C-methylase UbiE
MLMEAKNIHQPNELTSYVNSNAIHLPFKNDLFDHIIAFAVFPHLSSQRDALKEFSRILKLGGSLTILHLMGHKELNEMHGQAHKNVSRHHLPPAKVVAELTKEYRFHTDNIIEQTNLYLIRAKKSG